MAQIHLTHRALADLHDIEGYTNKEWGTKQSEKSITDIQEALVLISQNVGLLKINKKISNRFKVYFINKHWLVCDVVKTDIYLLTVRHISQNLLEKLSDLQPTLEEEAEILYVRLKKSVSDRT